MRLLAAGLSAQVLSGTDILRDAKLTNAIRVTDVKIRAKGEVASKEKFKTPVKITYVVKTESNNLRLGYAADQIIFNWERDSAQLRIDGGPAGGRHVHGAGTLPAKKFVTIVQEVTAGKMVISVNGVERAVWNADFSEVNDHVRIFSANSALTVRSMRIEKPQ